MAAAKTFSLEIVTPERTVFSGPVEFAVFPGAEGELGILPNHAPLLSALAPGTIKTEHDKSAAYFAVSGGFLEVRANAVVVCAETCEPAAEIDTARATAARDAAAQELKTKSDKSEIASAKNRLLRAEARIKTANKVAAADAGKH
jgi:F-type H+-transporting ATPase subunit epsilon